MKTALLIASAVAAVLAQAGSPSPVRAQADSMPPIDEKCYGVSARDVSVCGSDKLTCAYTMADKPEGAPTLATTGQDAKNAKSSADQWAYVPVGTCAKIYGGMLYPKS